MAFSNIELYVDEAYLIALINDETIPISDERYAQEISLQEALFSSSSNHSIIETKNHAYNYFPKYPKTEQENFQCKTEKIEVGGCSNNSKFILCGICMESKKIPEIFTGLSKCNHTYCIDCVRIYLISKIKENIAFVDCPYPKCKNLIEPENCNKILPKEVFSRWENSLCESLILGSQKFYCPYKECSVLMIDDGVEEVKMSECPCCRKLFCVRCRVKWHVGVTCEEFQKLKDDERETEDLMVMRLAKDEKWRRCSHCGFYVEKTDGCLHMTCRCSYEFCYQCGKKWSGNSHVCS